VPAFGNLGDSRTHCEDPCETYDHVPSKILMHEPSPNSLMVCHSCLACKNALSIEESVACLMSASSLAMPILR
jgi:hypothetical protein